MRDVLAGLSVAGLLLPSAIAYAAIAGLPPAPALIATLVGLGIYAACGRSRFAMVAPTSSAAAILGALLVSMHGRGTPEAITAVAVLATGAFFVVAGLARAGGLASFISRPVLRGFSFGIAVTITIKQLPAMLNVKGGTMAALPLLWSLLRALPHWHWAPLLLGAVALAILGWLRRYPAIPGQVLMVGAGILLSASMNLGAWHVGLVGSIALAFPHLSLPSLSPADWTNVIEIALPLFIILFAESWTSIRGLALPHGDQVSTNRELLALGCANLGAGLLQGMPVGAGFSASSAAEAAGAQSRLAGLVAMGLILVLALWGRGLIALLPTPIVSAVVIASLFHALDLSPLLRLWRIDRDQYVATAAVVAVLALGVMNGMLIAVGFSLLALLRRFSAARVSELGRLGDSHDFADLARHPEARTDPKILILRPAEPLFFANAEEVQAAIAVRAGGDQRVIILSMEESPDLDSTALDALTSLDARLAQTGQILLLARIKDHIRDELRRVGAAELADQRSYRSVADAFAAATRTAGPR
ncbi:MAG TPA: SulP family inorganic anion transporter [Acidocella sp.]|jgi:MFS superfamily sulfate permease-like transporter|nr:SulP family inorganic anion transporter [Acidocella sp.]